MNKKMVTISLVGIVVIFAWVVSMAGERVDPTGVLKRLLEIDRTHTEAVQSFLDNVKLDRHPKYGAVEKDEMPVHEKGWDNAYAAELFPKEKVEAISSITQATFSGTALAAHKAPNGDIFYVWHRYKDETGVFVTARLAGRSQSQTALAVVGGGNPVYLSSEDLVCRIDGHMVSMRMVKW
ncbi:MAG: hypothetical protein GY940_45525 [bacterium]|nr:hypothetical protein [bacterium]